MDLQLSSAVTLSPGTSPATRAGGDWRRGDKMVAMLLLAPALLYLIVMSIYPTIWSLWLAFHNYLVYQPDKASFAGFDAPRWWIRSLHRTGYRPTPLSMPGLADLPSTFSTGEAVAHGVHPWCRRRRYTI